MFQFMKVLVLKSEEYSDQSVPESGGKTSVGTKLFLISILAAISLSVSMKLMQRH